MALMEISRARACRGRNINLCYPIRLFDTLRHSLYEAMRPFALLMMLICKATIFIPLPSTAAVNMSYQCALCSCADPVGIP